MNGQTAMRRGQWKLVLNGQVEEGAPAADAVHLADIARDRSERHNIASENPDIVLALRGAADAWRAGIEDRWATEFQPDPYGTTAHPGPC